MTPTTAPLPRSNPETQGIPSSAITAFLEATEQHDCGLHSFMLLRDGNVVTEGWWSPYGPEMPHTLFSLSKSFTATTVGMAVTKGRLSVDDPVLSFFLAEAPRKPAANLAAIRVRHLLAMSTGHNHDTTEHLHRSHDGDCRPGRCLARPVTHTAGTRFPLQHRRHLHAVGHRAAGDRADAPGVSAAAPVRAVGHRRDDVGDLSRRRRAGGWIRAASRQRYAQVRPVLPAAGRLGRPTAAAGSLGGRHIRRADCEWLKRRERLGAGLRLSAGGFFLSGYSNGNMWSNAVARASLVEDYMAGEVGGDPYEDMNKIYVVKKGDKPFDYTWRYWEAAVSLGAEFYDGDGDGIYNPVDKNWNGTWDLNEDMPPLIGNEIAWCVYNDGRPANERRWQSQPQGIEVRQTIFATDNPELENVIFIRYSILNTGTVADLMDSVYFGIWEDGDLGDATDDVVGCDTLLNSGYYYADEPDAQYGENPPAFFSSFLQGPLVQWLTPLQRR